MKEDVSQISHLKPNETKELTAERSDKGQTDFLLQLTRSVCCCCCACVCVCSLKNTLLDVYLFTTVFRSVYIRMLVCMLCS